MYVVEAVCLNKTMVSDVIFSYVYHDKHACCVIHTVMGFTMLKYERSFRLYYFILFWLLAFDFCPFCVLIRFFSFASQLPMTLDFEGFLYQILSITLFSYLNSWEEPVFPFSITGTIFKRLWYDAVIDWGLNRDLPHSKPALYHYQGGGFGYDLWDLSSFWLCGFQFQLLNAS